MCTDSHSLPMNSHTLSCDVVDQGERLLRLAEMCRKLETEHEKVLPFYTSSLTAEEESQERANAMEPPSEELAQV